MHTKRLCACFPHALNFMSTSNLLPPPQAIALLDTLDKDVNTFVMRVREWYSWHFPELVKIVNDNYQYAQVRTCLATACWWRPAAMQQTLPLALAQPLACPANCLFQLRQLALLINQLRQLALLIKATPSLGTTHLTIHCLLHSTPSALQLSLLIKDKSTLGDDKLEAIKEVVGEEDTSREIIEVRCCLINYKVSDEH